MKKIIFVIALVMLSCSVYAVESTTTLKGMFGGTFNSTQVSDNWSGKEKNAQSWGARLEASLEKASDINDWTTTLKEEYGTAKIEGSETQTTADLIDFSSVYTRKISTFVNPYVGVIATTQHWLFLNPVTYTESLGDGIWLINQPQQKLTTRVGLAFKQLFDPVRTKIDPVSGLPVRFSLADDPATPQIEESRFDTGGEWITNYELTLNKTTKFITEARVFSAFKGGASLRWDSSLFVQLSKYLTLQLNYLAIYDFDQNPQPVWPQDIQKRFTMALGVAFNLF